MTQPELKQEQQIITNTDSWNTDWETKNIGESNAIPQEYLKEYEQYKKIFIEEEGTKALPKY